LAQVETYGAMLAPFADFVIVDVLFLLAAREVESEAEGRLMHQW
jgi:hypothetical protein